MKPDENPWQAKRLGNGAAPSEKGLLGTALAMLAGAMLLVLGFTFSLLILAAAAVIGVLGFGYLWWKTRALRKHIRQQVDYRARHGTTTPPMDSDAPDGDIIEGEVIREERETPG